MAEYAISGVWKDDNGVITHYAFHEANGNDIDVAYKVLKARAVTLINAPGNSARTILWNYSRHAWVWGEDIHVVNNSFLRSDPDSTERDNLEHLINYGWFAKNFVN